MRLKLVSLLLGFFCCLKVAKGTLLFRTNEGYDFLSPLNTHLVYGQFNGCATCKHFYTANFKAGDSIFLQVYVPPESTQVITVLKIIGPEPVAKFDKYEIDSLHLVARKNIFEIDTKATTNTSVILEIVSNSPHAHYGVRCGKEDDLDILAYTISFGYLTQQLRMWSNTFVFLIFFLILNVVYFFTWPLHRYKTYVVFPKVAAISFLSWVCDAFYQYFHIVGFLNKFSFLSFLFHIVPNVVFVVLLTYAFNRSAQKEVSFLVLAVLSFLIGGGGLYLGTLSLLVSYAGLITMKNRSEDKDKKILFCKV